MHRRYPAVLCLAMFLSTLGCASAPMRSEPSAAVHIWHVVIIHLNTPGDAAAQQKVVAASHDMKQRIPAIQTVYVGKVVPGQRPHQDSNFDVAIVMGFASKEDLAAYIAHPAHLQAVAEVLKPLAKDYTSYDFTNE